MRSGAVPGNSADPLSLCACLLSWTCGDDILVGFQARPHAHRALHPHLCVGLRDSAGGDAAGHSLQHQEVSELALGTLSLTRESLGRTLCWPLYCLRADAPLLA